jgi:hypothetical protein
MGSAKARLELENRPFTAHSTRWAITRRTRATELSDDAVGRMYHKLSVPWHKGSWDYVECEWNGQIGHLAAAC